jgi:hypothetical protein
MTSPTGKESFTAKRGCLWLLIGTPSLLVVYLFLLSTSLFDIKPKSYPDLEFQPEGKTIPILDALESSPDWAAWKASEETRGDLHHEVSSLIMEGEPIPPEMAEQARIEAARARKIAEDLLAIEGTFWPFWREEMGEVDFAGTTDSKELVFWLAMQLPEPIRDSATGTNLTPSSHTSLRFLAKIRMLSEFWFGRLSWLTCEWKTHDVLPSDILRAASSKDRDRLRMLLGALDETRPPEFPAVAVALGGEPKNTATDARKLRSKLGDLKTAHLAAFGTSTWDEILLDQWNLLRMQPNRSVDYTAGLAREFVAQAHLPVKNRIYPTFENRRSSQDFSLAPNAGRESFFSETIAHFSSLMEREDRGLARHQLLRLLIGLALYRIDHGDQLPAELGALVPAYLPEIPKDPFTGEPPLYDPVEGKLAFRGMDFVPSTIPEDALKEELSRKKGRPPGVVRLFELVEPHDPGVDLKAFFDAAE